VTWGGLLTACAVVVVVFFVVPTLIESRARNGGQDERVAEVRRAQTLLSRRLGFGFAAVFGVIALFAVLAGAWGGAAVAGVAAAALGGWGAVNTPDT
jgi:hypothetical protein